MKPRTPRRPQTSIHLRFVGGRAWDSKVIEWDTRCWCSHVEALCTNKRTLGAMLRGGVITRSIFDARYYSNHDRIEVWRIPATPAQAAEFWGFLNTQIDKPYDWRAIVSFGLGQRDWRAPDSWFCSELQSAALEHAGLIQLPPRLPTNRITPRDVYMLLSQIPGAQKVTP